MRRWFAFFLLVCGVGAAAQNLPRHARAGVAVSPEAAGTQLAQIALTPGYQSQNPGMAAAVSAVVVPGSGTGPTPTGTVTFMDSYNNATVQVGTAVSLSEGATMQSWTTLGVGSHEISGQYSGDSNYAGAASSPVVILVQKFSPTLMLSATSPTAAGIVTATATLVAAQGVAPTGSVTFTLDNATAGIVNLSGSAPTFSASQTITIPSGGSHTIGAAYSGDANYGAATATGISITSSKAATVTTLTALPSTLTAGTPETLTATVAAATGSNSTLTGTVTFYDGTTELGTPVTVAGNQASILATLGANTAHTVTAVYSGDANWQGSTSAPLVLTSSAAVTTVTLTASSPVAVTGSLETLTAVVTGTATSPSGAAEVPTGTVTFDDGTTPIGSATLQSATGQNGAGQNGAGQATATFFTTSLSSGSHPITAQYSGDANFKAGTSSAVTIAIQSFSVTPSATSLTLTQGQSGTITYTVADGASVSTNVQFACTPPANTFTACTFSPTAVDGNGESTLTITTTGKSATMARGEGLRMLGGGAGVLACLVPGFLVPGCLLPGCLLLGVRGRKRLPGLLAVVGLAAVLAAGAAATGCSSSKSSMAPASTPTPTGTQVFDVITSSTVNNITTNQETYITVDVLPGS